MWGVVTKWRGSSGLIRPSGRDVFVHARNFLKGSTPELDSLVEFQFGPSSRKDKPVQIVNVQTIQGAAEVLRDIAEKVSRHGGNK